MIDILTVFDSVTIISLTTLIFAFCGVIVRTCFLSKCRNCNICGLINIDRDVDAENEEMRIGVDQRTLARDETNNV